MSQPTSNSGNPPRRPINAGDDTTIFTAQPNTTINNNNNSNNTNNSNAYTSNNTTYNPKANNHQTNPHTSRQLNNNTNGSGTQRQISPTRSSENGGPKILKRELWWKETPASQVKILTNGKPSVNNVTAKVDHRNSGYNPNRSNGKQIESRKLEWNTRSAVDTWGNIEHKPQGGNKRYPTENLQWNALPKVDSGFIYTFDSNDYSSQNY